MGRDTPERSIEKTKFSLFAKVKLRRKLIVFQWKKGSPTRV